MSPASSAISQRRSRSRALAARPGVAGIFDTLWPSTTDRRLVTVAFWAPLLLPATVALAASLRIVSLWAMPAMTLLPVVLLSSPWLVISRAALVRLLALAVALPVVATLGGAGRGDRDPQIRRV